MERLNIEEIVNTNICIHRKDQSEFNLKKSVIKYGQLIIPKRNEDQGDDLFTTYSIIQESLQKGGVIYNNPRTGRVRRTRAITNGTRDFQLNTALWSMMESFRKEKVFKIA